MTDILDQDTVISTDDIPDIGAQVEATNDFIRPTLGPGDRYATAQELQDAITALNGDDVTVEAHFGATLHESVKDALKLALSQVGTVESPPGSNHQKYGEWFAAQGYGSYFKACAWCAIFQCWVGKDGSIPDNYRSAGAWNLADRFPNKGWTPGTLIGYGGSSFPDGHVEILVKMDGSDHGFTVGGNTSDNGLHTDGVWYVYRYFPGTIQHLGMPFYTADVPPPWHNSTFSPHVKNELKKVLNSHKAVLRRKLPLNGEFYKPATKALQRYLKNHQNYHGVINGHITKTTVEGLQRQLHHRGFNPGVVDGSWGPKTSWALKNCLDKGRF